MDPDTVHSLLLQVPEQQQDALRQEFEYILNMSCVGSVHHMLTKMLWHIMRNPV